jgi:hypothetical protein
MPREISYGESDEIEHRAAVDKVSVHVNERILA